MGGVLRHPRCLRTQRRPAMRIPAILLPLSSLCVCGGAHDLLILPVGRSSRGPALPRRGQCLCRTYTVSSALPAVGPQGALPPLILGWLCVASWCLCEPVGGVKPPSTSLCLPNPPHPSACPSTPYGERRGATQTALAVQQQLRLRGPARPPLPPPPSWTAKVLCCAVLPGLDSTWRAWGARGPPPSGGCALPHS